MTTYPFYKEQKESESEESVPSQTRADRVDQEGVEPVEEEHEDKIIRGRLAEDPSGVLITGQMTLLDIQQQTGISARQIVDKLGLPSTVPLTERLGRLKKMYPITIQEVRDIVSSLLEKK